MKAVVNRVPLHPGRMELRQVSGQIYDLTRADEPTVIGDPLDHDLFARIQADIRDVTVRAGQSIAAGDVVAVQGEEVYREVTAFDNVEEVLQSAAITASDAIRLSNQYSIVATAYNNGGSQYIGYLYLLDNASGKKVSSQQFVSNQSGFSYPSISLIRLSDTTFVVQYKATKISLRAKVCSVSSARISVGSEHDILTYSTDIGTNFTAVGLDEAHFMAISSTTRVRAEVFTITGTSIAGSTDYAVPDMLYPSNVAACVLAPDKVGICFVDRNGYGQAVIATVSGTVVTFGAVATFNSAATSYIDCCADDSDMVVSYVSGNVGYAKVLPVSGATINGSQAACSVGAATTTYTQICKVGNNIVMSYNNGNGKAVKLARSGNVLTKRQEYTFNSGATNYLASAALSNDMFINCYSDAGNNSYGTATLLTVNGDQIAGSFEDTSQDAIALESGAAGQRIAVAKSGNVQLAGVKAGDRIDSPGVSAYAPLDGWLTVTAKEMRPVTGIYTGNGLYGSQNPLKIDVGFKPSLIVLGTAHSNDNGYANPAVIPANATFLHFGSPGGSTGDIKITWTDTGVSLQLDEYSVFCVNRSGRTHTYVAFR